jgi:hypothetical protein
MIDGDMSSHLAIFTVLKNTNKQLKIKYKFVMMILKQG